MTSPQPPVELDAAGRTSWELLVTTPLAHRGLWNAQAPENSLPAFEAACEAGYGMELDVQLSADGEAVVFHDDRLDRMTAETGRLADRGAAELSRMRLGPTDETIPSLSEVLARVAGRGLVVIELKVLGGDEGALEARVAEVIDGYDGPHAVLSFNPHTMGWFAENRPGVLRGLNSWSYFDATDWMLPAEQRQALADLEHVEIARPHFVSLGLDLLPSARADELRAGGMAVAAWTVRSPADWARVSAHCDAMIFEGWRP